jgi:hypothetical protein
MAALSRSTDDSPRLTASTKTAPSTPSGHSSGANAAPSAMSSPVAHAARRAWRREAVTILAAFIPISGSITKANAVPSRPAATAPVATGSSA